MDVRVAPEVSGRLRSVFTAVEGSCEAWTDEEIVRRMLIRGAMEYAKSAGRSWDEVQQLAAAVRAELEG